MLERIMPTNFKLILMTLKLAAHECVSWAVFAAVIALSLTFTHADGLWMFVNYLVGTLIVIAAFRIG